MCESVIEPVLFAARLVGLSRYGLLMTLLTMDWHPFWVSYEWWRDIGTGLLTVVSALLVGASTLIVAIRSHLLARAVTERENKRLIAEADERYNARLTSSVENAAERVLDYIEHSGRTTRGLAVKTFAATSALTLTDAIARGGDRKVISAALAAFNESADDVDAGVRALVAGEVAGAIIAVVARRDPNAAILGKIQTAVSRARSRRTS